MGTVIYLMAVMGAFQEVLKISQECLIWLSFYQDGRYNGKDNTNRISEMEVQR